MKPLALQKHTQVLGWHNLRQVMAKDDRYVHCRCKPIVHGQHQLPVTGTLWPALLASPSATPTSIPTFASGRSSPAWHLTMNISDLLCSPTETPSGGETCRIATCKPPRPKPKRAQPKKRQAKVVPDDQRKRPYRMSVAQKKSRQNFEKHESKVFNLTLDVNQLKQQVQYLLECRDLQISCLLQNRQRLETQVLGTVDKILFGGSERPRSGDEGCSFSRMFMDQSDGATPPNGIYEFSLQLDKPNFNHRSCSIATTQVLSIVEEDPEADNEEAAQVRKVCGDPGGCLVEAVGGFTGRFTRQIIVSMFPHVLSDEMMVAQIIGLSITCPARLLLYFNAHQTIVRQVAQADVFSALTALQQAKPREFAAIMGTSFVS